MGSNAMREHPSSTLGHDSPSRTVLRRHPRALPQRSRTGCSPSQLSNSTRLEHRRRRQPGWRWLWRCRPLDRGADLSVEPASHLHPWWHLQAPRTGGRYGWSPSPRGGWVAVRGTVGALDMSNGEVLVVSGGSAGSPPLRLRVIGTSGGAARHRDRSGGCCGRRDWRG